MSKEWGWVLLLCLTTAASESSRDSSFPHLLGKRYSIAQTPRTAQWSYHQQEDSFRQGVSHGYVSHSHEPALKSTQEENSYPLSSQDHWRPSTVDSNLTKISYYGYPRTHVGLTSATGGPHANQDYKQGSYSKYQFQQTLPATGTHAAVKKIPSYHAKGNFQVQGFDVYGKSTYRKTNFRQSPAGHKKFVYPRVHKPYVKHKYPTRKTVHPLYKRYFQSPYQRYEIPSREMLPLKLKASTAPSSLHLSTPDRYHYTTERMDDAYPEGSSTSEDYSAYVDAARQKSDGNYYEAYEEVEKTTLEPEENSYEETTTRGYYGDRIYMSTQAPHSASDKAALKNKYFLVRRTSDDEDIETIFE